jgi:hypothetical protein
MKISDPFREAGWWFRVGEYHFQLRCRCGAALTVDALNRSEVGDVTVYACPQCSATLVGITTMQEAPATTASGVPAFDGEGHAMCGYVFGSMVDMTLRPPASGEGEMEIPARPGFFSTRGLL